jgi:MFS family permease
VHAAAYTLACIVVSCQVKRAANGLNWAMVGGSVFTLCITSLFFVRDPRVAGALIGIGYGCQSLVWPALHSWVGAEPDPATRSRNMGWFNVAWSSGFAVSPLLAGPMYDFDYRLPFGLLFLLGAASIALLRSLPHERDHYGVLTPELLAARAGHDRASESLLYAAWVATFSMSVLGGVTRAVFPKRVEDLVVTGELRMLFEDTPWVDLSGAAATTYSWLAFILSFATAAAFFTLGRKDGWRHRFRPLALWQAGAGVAFFTLAFTRSLAVMLACFGVIGAALGFAFFASVYYSLANPERKHARATLNEAYVGAGNFLGSIVFGHLAAQFGLLMPLRWTPVFIALVLAAQALLVHHGRMRLGINAQPERATS